MSFIASMICLGILKGFIIWMSLTVPFNTNQQECLQTAHFETPQVEFLIQGREQHLLHILVPMELTFPH